MSRCTAKAKSTGEQCQRSAKAGFNVCRVHGANNGAIKHGAYRKLVRGRLSDEDRAAFDSIDTEDTLAEELRILRFKIIKLIGDDVDQNVHGPHSTWTIKADEFERSRAIAHLAGEIRKLKKDMQDDSTDTVLDTLVNDYVKNKGRNRGSTKTEGVEQDA